VHRRVTRALLLLLVSAGHACGDRPRELAGFGPWNVPKTTVGMVKGGRCDPTDLPDGRKGVYCFGVPGLQLGSRGASVALYFSDGTARAGVTGSGANLAAPLIELQLTVRGCDATDLDGYLRGKLGAPASSGANRATWENTFILVAASLPDPDGSCLVRVFPHSERPEYERIRAPTP